MQFRLDRSSAPRRVLACAIFATLWHAGCGEQPNADGGQAGSGGAQSSGGVVASSGGAGASGGVRATSADSGGGAGGSGLGGSMVGSGGSDLASGGRAGSGGVGSGGIVGTGGISSKGSGGSGSGGAGGSAGSGQGGAGLGGSAGSGKGGGGGGTAGAGGSGGASTSAPGGSSGNCGSTTLNQHPFGCTFAWGIADPNGSLSSYSYVQFVSSWIDSSISASGTYTTCGGCNWLTSKVASTNLIPAYYAYIIGFYAHANGIVDGNQSGSKKLTTDGAAFVKANYNAIINAYTWYAKQTAKAWPSKPLVWLVEGDFVQFAGSSQSSPMSYADLGKLAADITCAIKSNMPNAVVAIDHSSWNTNDVTKNYWGAMNSANYDMVWTTGVGDDNGYIASGTTSGSYNAATGTYSFLHSLTGRTILVDTSSGASSAGDSWSTASAAQVNARIAEGVVAANITGTAPSGLQGNISNLSGLAAIPSCQ